MKEGSSKPTNKQRIFLNLEKIKTLESRIDKAGLGTIKPLAKELAKLTRQTLALTAIELFEREEVTHG